MKSEFFTFIREQVVKFVLGDPESEFVGGVDYKNDRFDAWVVFLPQTSVFALATHVKDSKVDVALHKVLSLKADRGSEWILLLRLGFQEINKGALAGVIEAHDDHGTLFLAISHI